MAAPPWDTVWLASNMFGAISGYGFGCSLILEDEPDAWYTATRDPRPANVVQFELLHGLERARAAHNAACLAEVRRTRRPYLGHRVGCSDYFVPVLHKGKIRAILACGPFLTCRPTSDFLRASWQQLAGTTPSATQNDFHDYVRGLLEAPIFEGTALDALMRWFDVLATAIAGGGPIAALNRRAVEQGDDIRKLVPEIGAWRTAEGLVNRYSNAEWTAGYRINDRRSVGLVEIPNYVIAVAPSEPATEERDVVDHLVRIDELERLCAAFATRKRNTVAGRLGEQGAFLLVYVAARRPDQARRQLLRVVDDISGFVRRRMRIDIVCGIGERALVGPELPQRCYEATWAVLWGLHRGDRATFYGDSAGARDPLASHGLYRGARALREAFSAGKSKETSLCVNRVVQDVLWASGGSVEAIRSHFTELLWELVAVIERRADVEPKTLSEMLASFTASLQESQTARELTTVFARRVRELFDAIERPRGVGLRAKLERAHRLIVQGHREPIDRASVARRVGVSPQHLSRRFKEAFGFGLRELLVKTRVDSAKQLLRGTQMTIKQIGEEAGFRSACYFTQAFKRVVGTTPERYRAQARTT